MRRVLSSMHFQGSRRGSGQGSSLVGRVFVCGVLLAMATVVAASVEPVLSTGVVKATEGQTVNTNVRYSDNGARVSGFQFDLHYNRNAIHHISAALGPAAKAAGKSLFSNVLPNGNIRYLVFGFNQTVIEDGDVIDLTTTMASEVEPGSYSLQMLNAIGTDPNGNAVPIQVQSGKIVVSPPDN